MILTKEDFKVGNIVVCKHVGNRARYSKGCTFGKVYKVGRKLITIAFDDLGKSTVQFKLDEGFERDYLLQKTNYSGDFELFPSEKAYLDHEEKQEKLEKIQSAVSTIYNRCTLTIDQVRRIYDIISE